MRKIALVKVLLLVAVFAFPQQKRLVLQNVNVVDIVKGTILKNQNVIISGDRITEISRAARFGRQVSDSVVDCSGQYLIPGLWDMHTHVWSADYFFSLFIANGVTGIRGMFETMFNINQWKKSEATPGSLTPTGFYTGPIVDGPTPIWPGSVAVKDTAGGRRAVDSLKNKLQVDFIKVYSLLGKDSYYAIADEAKKQQIVFAGHVKDPRMVYTLQMMKNMWNPSNDFRFRTAPNEYFENEKRELLPGIFFARRIANLCGLRIKSEGSTVDSHIKSCSIFQY